METLYDDLENYNDVNTVAQLRDENNDLKLKLEEYEKAMGKLQKDYDNLAMEFRNLQMNYSSLLKTARAEVERKTKMITQLNLDKNMMVLQSLQNRNNRRLPNSKNRVQQGPGNNTNANINTNASKNIETSKVNIGKNENNEKTQSKSVAKHERYDANIVSRNTPGPSSGNTKLLNIVDKVVNKVEACINNGELKENNAHCKLQLKEVPKIHPSSIRNRRKSMPAVSFPKFSSDEEYEPKKPTDSNETPLTENSDIKNIRNILSRISDDRQSNRTSGPSSIDGRSSSNQEPPRECYKNKPSRPFDSDKNRGSDKLRETERCRENRFRDNDRFRNSDRFRDTDWSRGSDRFRDSHKFREADKYRDSNKHREIDRYRGKEKYDPFQRNRKNYSPERPHKRSYREYQDDYHRSEYGRHRVVESPPKVYSHHKTLDNRRHFEGHTQDNDYDSPHYEERQSGQSSMPIDHVEPSNKRQKIEPDVHFGEGRRRHDTEPTAKTFQAEVQEYELLRTSCLSPDVAFTLDMHTPAHIIKEIRHTAIMPLEDPRVTSKKYVLKSEDGKAILSTLLSNSVDIRPIKKSQWNIEPVAMPDALKQKPQPQLNDQHIKDIYMDFDNLEVNVSVESGEIQSNLEDNVYEADREKETERTVQDDMLSKQGSVSTVPQKHMPVMSENVKIRPYRIPKLKQSEQKILSSSDLAKNMPKSNYDASGSSKPKALLHIDQIMNADKVINKNNTKEEKRISLSEIAMVRDDLELSDETSDCVDFHKGIVEKETVRETQRNVIQCESENKSSFNLVTKGLSTDAELPNLSDVPKYSVEPSHNNQKRKKRKTKSKEKELEDSSNIVQISEKKIKSKKDKECINIKDKFTDLFGDSSSLITPDDLGIPITCVPLCEDAQDAIDININKPPYTDIVEPSNKNNLIDKTKRVTDLYNKNKENDDIVKQVEYKNEVPVNQTLNFEVHTDKVDVVKTVIISTGVQPQVQSGNKEGAMEKRVADVEVNIQNIVECNQPPAIIDLKKQNALKALATSTPFKDLSILNALETDSSTVDEVNKCNDSKNDSVDTTGQSVDQSDNNTQESCDAPDVRIFVRRRRKGAKKP